MPWGVAATAVSTAISTDASKKASEAGSNAARRAANAIGKAGAQGRSDVTTLFPQAQESLFAGSRGAFDTFNQALGAQQQALSQGNLNAQGTVSAGLPQIRAALLGLPTSFSSLAPSGVDLSQPFVNPFNLAPDGASLLGGFNRVSIPEAVEFRPRAGAKDGRSTVEKIALAGAGIF